MSQTQSEAAGAATTTEAEGGLGLLDQVIGATKQTERDRAQDLIKALTEEALKGTVTFSRNLQQTFDRAIAAIDQKVSQQLNAIMHNERFSKLEGSWRGLPALRSPPGGDRDTLTGERSWQARSVKALLAPYVPSTSSSCFGGFGSRPALRSASRSTYSICALTERSSSSAQRCTASMISTLMRSG